MTETIDKIDMDDFVFLYGPRIESFTKNIQRQFISICSGFTRVNIEIVEEGTCIKYREKRNVIDGKVYFVEEITLNIGYKEISLLYESSDNLDIFEAFNKLVAHEYLHVLFQDYSESKLTLMQSFYEGSLDKSVLNKFILLGSNSIEVRNMLKSPYYDYKMAEFDNLAFNRVNLKAANVAFDFVINSYLDIRNPFMHPKDFDLPDDLKYYEYYKIIMETLDREKDRGSSGPMTEAVSQMEESSIIESIKEIYQNNFSPVSDYKASHDKREFEREHRFGNLQGYNPALIEEFHESTEILQVDLNKILRGLRKEYMNMKLGLVSKKDSWSKYNNRKESDFMYPGKIESLGVIDRKMKPKPIFFIDCSASMESIAEITYSFCYRLLKDIDCELIFYDIGIINRYDNSGDFKIPMPKGGGTSIRLTLEEYLESGGSSKDIYVITDGGDMFDYLPEGLRYKIWILDEDKGVEEHVLERHKN